MDMNAIVRDVVREQLGVVLGSLAAALVEPAEPRARRAGPAPAAPRARRAAGDPAQWAIGQAVVYRQGRGKFRAVVVGHDATGAVEVKRDADGKRVCRPASKLAAA